MSAEPSADLSAVPPAAAAAEGAVDADVAPEAFRLAHLEALEQELVQIERAMAGLQDGTYGRCAHCGAPVPDDVLADDPLALSCGAHLVGLSA